MGVSLTINHVIGMVQDKKLTGADRSGNQPIEQQQQKHRTGAPPFCSFVSISLHCNTFLEWANIQMCDIAVVFLFNI